LVGVWVPFVFEFTGACCCFALHIIKSGLYDGADITNEAEFYSTGCGLGFVFVKPVSAGISGVAEEAGVTVELVDGFVEGGGLECNTCVHIGDVSDKGGFVFTEFCEVGFESGDGGVVEFDGCGFISFIIGP